MTPKISSIPPKPADLHVPLSLAQQRLWFVYQYDPQSSAYNISRAWRLRGRLNRKALAISLNLILARHEVLRTTFQESHGSPVQIIQPACPLTIAEQEFSYCSPANLESEINRIVTNEPLQPFNLTTGPPIRFTLLRCGPEDHVFLFAVHHIVFDGTSLKYFCQELSLCYQAALTGQPASLRPLSIQYQDFAYWQQHGKDDGFSTQLEYWRKQLDGAPLVLELPSTLPRPKESRERGQVEVFTIEPTIVSRLKQLLQPRGLTMFMGLLAVFQILLARYTGQRDLLVGSPIAGRTQVELEGLLGFFVNRLVLRGKFERNSTFHSVLQHVRKTCLEAYRHQALPFEKLVEALQPNRDFSRDPIVQMSFQFRQSSDLRLTLPQLSVQPFPITRRTGTADLQLICEETGSAVQGFLYYPDDLFPKAMMSNFVRHFLNLLKGLINEAQQSIWRVPFLTDRESTQQLIEWNHTNQNHPPAKCFHELFEEQVDRTPDSIAVVDESTQLTYKSINRRANFLTKQLQLHGIGPGAVVPVLLDRSPELVIAYLAILKTGAAFAPFDPEWPTERILELLTQLESQVVLVAPHTAILPQLSSWQTMIVEAKSLHEDPENVPSLAQPDHPAYLIFTSGSTGTPKGALNHHRGLVNRLWNMQQRYPWSENDVVLVTLRHIFDASLWQYLWPLVHGARLVLPPPSKWVDLIRVVQLIEQEQITLTGFVPSVFHLLVEEMVRQPSLGSRLRSVQHLMIGGEVLHAEPVNQFRMFCPEVRITNTYGPAEASISTIYFDVPNPCTDPIPIGRPLKNVKALILGDQLNLLPVGVPGELHLGGICVGLGYLNNPDATQAAFIPNPYPELGLSTLYKTGDQACFQEDGTIRFLGRLDHQVKIHGVRMELGEIEAALRDHPAVSASVVLCREDMPGEKQLVAYIVVQATVNDLRLYLQSRLPEYMVPSAFVVLEQVPITPNGKIDRRALPAPNAADRTQDMRYVAPQTTLEELLVEIWQEVCHVERIGVHDNFFDLGGHSLLATKVITRLGQVLELSVPLRTIFEHPTIAQLAQTIDTQLTKTFRTD